jgi:glutamate carboxypeptidase
MTNLPAEPRSRRSPWPALFAALVLSCAPPSVRSERPETPLVAPPRAETAAPAEPPRPLDATEAKIAAYVDEHNDEAIALLERVVNMNSGTMSFDGVRAVGDVFAKEFRALGFETRWIPMDSVHRAGHLFAERKGTSKKRVLLIGHLDTVFEKESPFQRFERVSPTVAKGPGTVDMKGGDIAILYALKALAGAGALDRASIVVAFTGDEENPGDPVDAARKDLVEVAKHSDAALEFEQGIGGPNSATVARRGTTTWTLQVRGKPGHSSGIFSKDDGAGAIYEAARILHTFYDELRGEPYLTFNAGLVLGGNSVEHGRERGGGTASGKSNIIPQSATVTGDLRTLTAEQLARTKERMRAIVEKNLAHTSAEIKFEDGYPPMAPTEGNKALLRELEGVSRDLGLGRVDVIDPGKRGAADISFVAPFVASLAGLGPSGDGPHAPGETVDLASLPLVTKRAALLIHRLTRE